MNGPALAAGFSVLQAGTLWHNPAWTPTNGKCPGYADANPVEAQTFATWIAGLAGGNGPALPPFATKVGQGLAQMLLAMAATPPPPPPPASVASIAGVPAVGIHLIGAIR